MLDEYMLNIGYNEEQIKMIKNSYPLNNYTESTMLYNMKNFYNFMHKNGLENKNIISITLTIPNIICKSTEDIKIKIKELSSLKINKIDAFKMIKNYPYIIEMSFEKIKNKISFLTDIGFNQEQIKHILLLKTEILALENNSIKKRISSFLERGYLKKDILYIFSLLPSLFDCNMTLINKKVQELIDLGFEKEDTIKITSLLPEILINEKEKIQDKFKFLLEYGYEKKNIINIIKRLPILLKANYWDIISEKISNLENLKFSKLNIIAITIKNPYLLLYSTEFISNHFHNICELGYSIQDTIKMITEFPLLLGYDSNNVKNKFKFYKKCKLDNYIVNNSKLLMFNLELIKARYKIITDNNIDGEFYKDLFEDNSSYELLVDNLFLNDEDFYFKFKVSRINLLKGV